MAYALLMQSVVGRGVHSSTSQPNVNTFCGIGELISVACDNIEGL